MFEMNKKKWLNFVLVFIFLMIIIVALNFVCSKNYTESQYIYDYDRYFAYELLDNNNDNSVDEAKEDNESEINVYAHSAVCIDYRDGHILYGKNYMEEMPMASTTKILTAIIALEVSEPDEIVTVSHNAANSPKVRLGIKEGEQYYLKDLLFSMMLGSHNDSAVAIAEHIGGSIENFAVIMNKKAVDIGLENSNFVTPNGLDADDHYSTAYDMAKLGAYAMKNEEFVKLVNTPAYSFSEFNGKSYHSVNNINSYLTIDDTAIGVKTGFTCNAGYCFVGANEYENTVIMSTVLACGWPPNKTYKWQDMKKIVTYVTENYSEYILKVPELKINLFINGDVKEIYCKSYNYEMLHKDGEEVTRLIKISKDNLIQEYLTYGNVVKKIEDSQSPK